MFREIDISQYPICDSDIWVDINIANIVDVLFQKYEKIVIADVVWKEILNWKHNPEFGFIATNLEKYIDTGQVIIIKHDEIETTDRMLLEKQLLETDFNFVSGLVDNPHEKNKGEIVSALYAVHFELPFLKSNDGTFKRGKPGRMAFPDLIVKNRKQTLMDLIEDVNRCNELDRLIQDNRTLMNEGQRIYKQELEQPVTQETVEKLLKKMRGQR